MDLRSPRFCASVPLLAAGLCSLLAICLPAAHAQSVATGVKTYELSVFGGATSLEPKFGVTISELGFVAGGDIKRHFRIVDVSFEARYTSATGFSADESTYQGGLKAERAFSRFHPYIDFMVGGGKIKFDHPEIYGSTTYTHDNSFVYDFGGGLDYDLVRNFAIKLDVQGQRWEIGVEKPPFYPYNASIGVLYRIPFRPFNRRHR